MARERYILRNPHDINDEHAVNASVQIIRASDGDQFLGMPLPDAFCVDKTPKPRKPNTGFDNNAAVKAAKAALQRSVTGRRTADGDIEMGSTGVEHGGNQGHAHPANASGPTTSTPNERPREDNLTDFDVDGKPVLWDEYGEPRLDQEGSRLYRDSTGMIVRKGITYDRKNKPVSPYGEGFIWKQGRTPYKGQTDGGEDGGEKIYVRDIMMQDYAASQKMRLKTAVLPVAAITLSRILNHPNIVSLIDIVDNSSRTGEVENAGIYNNITVWEDMTAGCLADLLPSVPAPEHPKAALNVFHSLHCLDTIRKVLHPDIYDAAALRSLGHIPHCFDILRESIMCTGDTSVSVWQWIPGDKQAKQMTNTPHTCRNFDKIKDWAEERRMSVVFDDTTDHTSNPLAGVWDEPADSLANQNQVSDI